MTSLTWEENAKLVLSEIDRLDKTVQHLIDKVESLRTDVAVMKVKYGLIGGLCGAIPGIAAIILRFIK
jgi:hypothetical protein